MKKIISKEGKLFGLINIIDFIVLLFALAAIAVAVMFLAGNIAVDEKENHFKGPTTDMDIVYYTEEVSCFVGDHIRLGSTVFDDTNLHSLGEIVDFDLGDNVAYIPTATGEVVEVAKDDFYSAYITSRINSTRTRFGLTHRMANYGIGHSMTIRAGEAKIYLRIYDIHATQRRLRRPLKTTSDYKFLEMCK